MSLASALFEVRVALPKTIESSCVLVHGRCAYWQRGFGFAGRALVSLTTSEHCNLQVASVARCSMRGAQLLPWESSRSSFFLSVPRLMRQSGLASFVVGPARLFRGLGELCPYFVFALRFYPMRDRASGRGARSFLVE